MEESRFQALASCKTSLSSPLAARSTWPTVYYCGQDLLIKVINSLIVLFLVYKLLSLYYLSFYLPLGMCINILDLCMPVPEEAELHPKTLTLKQNC